MNKYRLELTQTMSSSSSTVSWNFGTTSHFFTFKVMLDEYKNILALSRYMMSCGFVFVKILQTWSKFCIYNVNMKYRTVRLQICTALTHLKAWDTKMFKYQHFRFHPLGEFENKNWEEENHEKHSQIVHTHQKFKIWLKGHKVINNKWQKLLINQRFGQ